jgi:hypothetical protein
MSDQEKKQQTSITPQPGTENKGTGELSAEELNKVAGGAPTATAKQQPEYLKITMTNATITSY